MISSIIESGGSDFVHFTAGRKDGEGFGLKWMFNQIRLPYAFRRAISRAKPDIVHINTAFEPRALVRDASLTMFTPKSRLVVHVHGGRFVMEDLPTRGLQVAADRLLKSAAKVIVLGDVEREKLLKRTPGIDVEVLPNAVSVGRFPKTERPWGEKKIVYIGRLDEAKGLSEMVESCRVLAEQGFKFNFACYGTGRDQDEFFRRMKSVLGDRFHYGGVVGGREKIAALRSADVFLMPSRFEGLPLALLEAMAAGCIPVVSERGSIPSVVEDGRNGFLVDPGDITQIVGKLKFLLSEGETGWNQVRESARQTIVDGYDLSEYSKKLRSIYSAVVDAAGKE